MDFTVGVYFRASVKVRYRVKSVSLKMVPTPAQNSISTYAQCSIIRKKNCKLGNRGGTGTQTPGFGYPQYRGAY